MRVNFHFVHHKYKRGFSYFFDRVACFDENH